MRPFPRRLSRRLPLGAAAASVLLIAPSLSRAQLQLGQIQGTITNRETGQPLPGVTVVVNGPAMQGDQTEVSDKLGRYLITQLPPGDGYTLRFYYNDVVVERPGIRIGQNKTLAVNLAMTTQRGRGERIVLHERAPNVDTATASTGVEINQELLQNTAVRGRTFESVISLAPGSADVAPRGNRSSASVKSFDLVILSKGVISPEVQNICFPLLFAGFGVFTALFPFHTWVPDGHSSAPTAGSMFLAGISMKLGGYGCLRVATYLLPQGAQHYANVVIALSVIAIVYGAFATMMQKDLKYINAYSSVSHCGFVLLGIGMLTKTSMTGAVMQMVSHGLMTALFFAVIGMIYDRTHTRQVSEMGGLLKTMPFIGSVLFIVGLCSLGLPGLSGFVAEMTVFMGSWENPDRFSRIATILSCLSIVVTAVYILRAVGKVAMGPIRADFAALPDASWNEKLAAIVLVVGILAIGTAPFWLNDLVNPATEIIKQKLMMPVPLD
ncbi:MAG TPA: NADH-quinone oxidoreductase subunit M [Ferruginibacter sp.]|nr:NADH-quinone oxidoreductase subunit M [Ferruginibacter sp.]